MKAVRVTKDGSSTSVAVEDVPKPKAGDGELLLKIRASPLQPSDILNSKGGFPNTTFPRILGRDFAGTVISGPDPWKGKDVYGSSGSTFSFTEDGAQAEYALLKPKCVALKPKDLSFAQAASVGTPFSTALMGLRRARAQKGETVMVLGGTGAVGSAVVQIAGGLLGCKTISVGRHGADLNSVEDPELEGAKKLTDGRGPDVVFDTVGDFALTKAAFNVLATKGRLVMITAPRQGSTELGVDILSLYRREVELVGCNSGTPSQEEVAALMEELKVGFDEGKLKAPEEKGLEIIGVDRAVEAYEGKIKKAVIAFDE